LAARRHNPTTDTLTHSRHYSTDREKSSSAVRIDYFISRLLVDYLSTSRLIVDYFFTIIGELLLNRVSKQLIYLWVKTVICFTAV